MPRIKARGIRRPDVSTYQDVKSLLGDWLLYLKGSQSPFTLSRLSSQTGISVSYLSMLFQSKRPLTRKVVPQLATVLEWDAAEIKKIETLISLANGKDHEEQQEAFARVARQRAFQRLNPQEAVVYEYLSHWYHIAIREMASLAEFRADPEWIQSRLWKKVGRAKIATALEFLFANGFLEKREDGSVVPPNRQLDCQGHVYRLALRKFYGQIYELAAKSIDSVPGTRRNLQSYTLAVDAKTYQQVHEIIENAYKQIERIAKDAPVGDEVYHVALAVFPFTQTKPDGSEGSSQ